MESFGSLIFLGIIAMLFLTIVLNGRKQKKAYAEALALQASLQPGDVVITTSGLRGTVVDASYEETVDLEIADDVVTTWVRAAIRERIDPGADTAAADPVAVDNDVPHSHP